MEFAIGGLAAAGAGFFTNPIQVSKAHLKVSAEMVHRGRPNAPYKNAFHAGYLVAKREGILALQKGLTSSLWMHLIKYGVKLGTYHTATNSGFTKDENGQTIVLKSVLVCGLGGLAGQVLATPMYVVRTLLQHEAAKGNPHHHSLLMAIKDLHRKEGVRGLFKGIKTCVPYAFIGTSQLTAFGCTKDYLNQYDVFKEDKLLTATIAGTSGAVVLSALMTPFDNIVSKYNYQAKDSKGKGLKYSSYTDCILKTYRAEGAASFVRGFGSMFLKIGPHTILCLVFWDGLKHLQENYWKKPGSVY